MVTLKCDYCQKEVKKFPSRLKDRKNVYCSTRCKKLAQVQPGSSVEKICEVCGKPYTVKRFFALKRNSRYCSKACMNQGISNRYQGEGNPIWVDRISTHCAECGKEFYILESIQVFGQGKFCSTQCRDKYHSKTYKGPKRWNWKHGKRSGPGNNGYGKDWDKISNAVRERDHWTCQKCGKKPMLLRNLHVHHKIPFRTFNGNTELANRMDNLVSLCSSCHKIEDAKIRRASPPESL